MELETVTCLLCASSEAQILSYQGEKREYRVNKCSNCGFIYLSPRPTADSIDEIYNEEYYKDGKTGYFDYEKTYYKYEKIYNQFFEIRENLLLRFKKYGKLLEIGCAYGFQLKFLEKKGWEVTGTDVSPLASSYAREQLKLNVLTGNLKEQRFPDNSFDVILLIDVLEHMHDAITELAEIKRILKHDGILLVQVPYELFHWEEYLEAIFKGLKPGSITPDALPAHLYFFSPRSLRKLLSKCGYRLLCRTCGNYGAVRSKIAPPKLNDGNLLLRLFKKIYFIWGLQKVLYYLTKIINQGNGIIYVAQPEK